MKLHGATLWWPIHLSAWRDCMKSPDRCRTGTPPSAETAPQGSISAFRATEDPPSGLLQLLFIQSRRGYSPKFAGTEFSEVQRLFRAVAHIHTPHTRVGCMHRVAQLTPR